MRWTSILAIYVLFWSLSVFLALPFGVRTHEEAGADRVPGQADSAPHGYDWRRMAIRTTIIATILFGLYYANYVYGWVTPADLDYASRYDN
jgi:predicted secreted protein